MVRKMDRRRKFFNSIKDEIRKNEAKIALLYKSKYIE